MSEKPMYGSAHQNKWPHVKRVLDMFEEYERKHKLPPSSFPDLRNEIFEIINEIYQSLAIQLKHELSIPSSRRTYSLPSNNPNHAKCEICGDNRVTNKAHIIPRELGGSNSDKNYLNLCANHHYLFDQAKLTKDEFSKIDVSNKSSDAIEYFKRVRLEKQERFWRSVHP